MTQRNSNGLSPKLSASDAASNLHGNTLLVYWYMLKENRPHSSREIQRGAGLSSSSLALHHLNKLIELGVVGLDKDGGYVVIQRVSSGILSLFAGSGRFFIPRFLFYASFFTALLISSIIVFWGQPNALTILLILSLFLSSLVFWFETARILRIQPL